MRRYIIACCLIWLFALPALAIGAQGQIVYVQQYIVFPAGSQPGATSNSVYTLTNPSNAPNNGIAVAWTRQNDDAVATDYQLGNDSASLVYVPPLPLAPGPDVPDFEAAILADKTLTATAKIGIATFFPLLESAINSNDTPTLQNAWTALIAANAASWLTPSAQTTIANYATTYNIPL